MTKSLAVLEGMTYPGRVILIGLDRAAEHVIAGYAITGRSPSSQARRLKLEAGSIWTEPSEEEAIRKSQAKLLIYRAMAIGRGIAVSNGRQTEEIIRAFGKRKNPEDVLRQALRNWTYEPDAPHFTPRISGCALPNGRACMNIIKRAGNDTSEKLFFAYDLEPGKGRIITTYSGKEATPLPSFSGDPLAVEIKAKDATTMAEAIYSSLKPKDPEKDYRVAVACVYASSRDFLKFDAHIINKSER
ncbi:MAG: IMP cyclohydrolase [Clostridiales bacterium]|nr:IMP cyclohydrolase [Clostridiales bacterium]